MPRAMTARSASRVHSVENGTSGKRGFTSDEEKWECLSIRKSICCRSNGGLCQVKQERSAIELQRAGVHKESFSVRLDTDNTD